MIPNPSAEQFYSKSEGNEDSFLKEIVWEQLAEALTKEKVHTYTAQEDGRPRDWVCRKQTEKTKIPAGVVWPQKSELFPLPVYRKFKKKQPFWNLCQRFWKKGQSALIGTPRTGFKHPSSWEQLIAK